MFNKNLIRIKTKDVYHCIIRSYNEYNANMVVLALGGKNISWMILNHADIVDMYTLEKKFELHDLHQVVSSKSKLKKTGIWADYYCIPTSDNEKTKMEVKKIKERLLNESIFAEYYVETIENYLIDVRKIVVLI